jgi:hypothetical protein
MSRADLIGDNLVRIAFLDEAGRSSGEPSIVVAGPIVHGDRTYRRLVERLRDIAAMFVPAAERKDFIFHAKDIYHGSGHYFKRRITDWPPPRRFEILRALSDIPREFGLPITFGSFEKEKSDGFIADASRKVAGLDKKKYGRFKIAFEHVAAFMWAEIGIEQQMNRFPRDEICMIVAEDTDLAKSALKEAHAALRDKYMVERWFAVFRQYGVPLKKIEDTPHFASKSESAPLQIADTCSFLIMRRLMRRTETQEFFEAIAPQLVWAPTHAPSNRPVFGDPIGNEQIATGERY